MDAFAELLANARASSRLKPRYHWANSAVGLLAVLVGIGVLCLTYGALSALLDLDPAQGLRQAKNGALWTALFFVAIPVSLLGAAVPVAWVSGLLFVRMGYMAPSDVKYYALRSRYPAHWLKEHGPEPLS